MGGLTGWAKVKYRGLENWRIGVAEVVGSVRFGIEGHCIAKKRIIM